MSTDCRSRLRRSEASRTLVVVLLLAAILIAIVLAKVLLPLALR